MADVFISYRNLPERRAYASRLALILRAHGLEVWWDYGLAQGESYRQQITDELARARVVVPLWCEEGVRSNWIAMEAELGRDKLSPARLQNVSPPDAFEGIHAADLIGWDGSVSNPRLQAFVQRLCDRLGKPGKAPAETLEELAHLPKLAPLPMSQPIKALQSLPRPSMIGNWPEADIFAAIKDALGPQEGLGVNYTATEVMNAVRMCEQLLAFWRINLLPVAGIEVFRDLPTCNFGVGPQEIRFDNGLSGRGHRFLTLAGMRRDIFTFSMDGGAGEIQELLKIGALWVAAAYPGHHLVCNCNTADEWCKLSYCAHMLYKAGYLKNGWTTKWWIITAGEGVKGARLLTSYAISRGKLICDRGG